MDDRSREPVKKSLPTIRHLLATSIDENERKKQSSRRLIGRTGPFKWRRGRRKTTEEKGPGLNTIPDDHCGESESSTEEIDFDEFSDALSHTHTEACSLSMVSDINSVDDDQGSVHAESRRSFIMDRFLPAAKAMAASESSAQRTQAVKERRVSMGRAGSRSAGPLPRQSRPYVLANPSSALRETDDDEDDDRLPFKMACGSFFAWHLKNAFGHVVYPPVCARKKTTDRRSLYEDEEDEDSSSGTDIIDERAIIAAARKKAWEARYGRNNNGLATSSPSSVAKSNDLRDSSSPLMDRTSYNSDSRSQSPLRKTDKELLSPIRNNRLRSPEFNQQAKGFLGFPSDRRLKKSIKAEDTGVQYQAAASSNVNSVTDSNEVEQEDWYSGNSSPSPEISENSDSVTIEKGSHLHDHNILAVGNVGQAPVVSMLPPPLPKSPTESWLWRAMPLVTASNSMNSPLTRGLGRAIKTHPDEFDAKWETI